MLVAFWLSPMILRSHGKVPAGKGQHPEMTLLSSGTIPALVCYPQLRNQADTSRQAHLSDCTPPRVKRAPWRSNGGKSQAPEGYSDWCWQNSPLPEASSSFILLRLSGIHTCICQPFVVLPFSPDQWQVLILFNWFVLSFSVLPFVCA